MLYKNNETFVEDKRKELGEFNWNPAPKGWDFSKPMKEAIQLENGATY